ncbi:hypothetical protein THARTR1_07756 [Trichoderma harzianum]|uniref:Uncharacterized protein n=1 Tax=Trichoderma harzianum TaxID=5544 RepID=A0A2K0U1J1_TRIHA|nr:hypothetical protein THARTR1_07756 [Trichoderma harzianum]
MTYLRIPDLVRDDKPKDEDQDQDEDEVEEAVDRDKDKDKDRDRDQQGDDTDEADDAVLPNNRPCRNPTPYPTPTPILASPAIRCSHPRAPSRRCTSLITPPMPQKENPVDSCQKRSKSPASLTT